jgi:2-methylisocitrate lyase-like PEP mutase family enzyme
MEKLTQREKANRFAALHQGPGTLVLVNAWDVSSARIFEAAGSSGIATTSAGIANALGYPDGQRISRAEMLEMVRRIAAGVAVPVSADVEAGYGEGVEAAVATAKAVLAAGAVGMNFEDATGADGRALLDVSLQVERIRAIRETASAAGVHLVINARTDVFLRSIGEPATRLDHAISRANAYRQGGADCLFVPGVTDRETIARLVRGIEGPVNILAVGGTPSIPELHELGVARVSVGSGPMRAAMGLAREIARELLERGTYTSLTRSAIPYSEMSELLQKG